MTAQKDALRAARDETIRFLNALEAVIAEEADATSRRNAGDQWAYASRLPHAAAKRASMDLTRALTNFRKPGAI